MPFTLAIVGRPNVGKSTLFNRLVGKRIALVDDQPGVTRDLREGAARLGDLRFSILDTAGLETAQDDSLPARMRRLTERAVADSDACLFMVDGRAGVTPQDEIFADLLRRSGATVLLVVNKAEGRAGTSGIAEGWGLGLGEPIAISAEHAEGMDDLREALRPHVEARLEIEARTSVDVDDEDAEFDPEAPIQIAVVGRPNAGKSTLVNAILGEERLLTGPEAGITRDAIGLSIDWGGRDFKIFDTAGLRKRAKVVKKIEKLSTSDAVRAVRFAEVVVVLLDIANPFETQDLRIADLAAREGRAVILAVNKWDLEENKPEKLKELRETFDRLLPQLRGAPLVTVSALTGRGLEWLRKAIIDIHEIWNIRLPTSPLNRWLKEQVEAHPPPAPSGRRIKLRYITQVKARPPTFLVFCQRPEALPESYTRFLINGLRADFGIKGVPIRLNYRKSENPYAYKAEHRGRPKD